MPDASLTFFGPKVSSKVFFSTPNTKLFQMAGFESKELMCQQKM
jgi:hypothetical protein